MNTFSMLVSAVFLALAVFSPNPVSAATSPVLVGSASYSVLGSTQVTCTGATTVTGNVGVTAGTLITGFPSPCVVSPGTTQSNTASAIAAKADFLTAYGVLDSGANSDPNCIGGILPSGTDLTAQFPAGIGPGLYCSAGAFLLTGNLNLTGSGVWIFKMVSALVTSSGSSVTGGDPCNIWWRVNSSATLGTTTAFKGNILALTDINMDTGATLNGRAMVQNGQVTMDANTISGPICVAGAGGGSPSGPVPVPPLIDVIKVPNPLSLPNGPGPVTYTYTARNIGTVPMTTVTMVGDTCSPIVLQSGDTNNNGALDLTEAWVYTCTTTLTATHTNTVTATGYSLGLSSTHTASSTVVVGAAITPPLIHVVKVPSVFVTNPGGGTVTYNYTVTNPGTEPLGNVSITDDRCTGLPSQIVGHPGDVNQNGLLESNEVWQFTCVSNLTATTTNTATASGTANGLTITDIATATVVVPSVAQAVVPPPPGVLPGAGLPPRGTNPLWNIIIPVGILLVLVLFYINRKKIHN